MNEKRICSIDLFRIICSLMVVAIHTSPLTDNGELIGYFATQIIPRVAVPYFFCISGYFYIKNIESGKEVFKNTFCKIFKTYVIWTVLYYLVDLIIYIKNGMDAKSIIYTFIVNFFIYGSSYHFWYIVALLFAIVIVTVAYKLKIQRCLAYISIVLYIIGLLGCSYYEIGNRILGINILINSPYFEIIRRILLMGLPFFMLGYFIVRCEEKGISKYIGVKLILSVVLFLMEIWMVNATDLQSNIIITGWLYIVIANLVLFFLKNPMGNYSKQAKSYKAVANYTYYVHPFMIWIINTVFSYELGNTLMFILISILCLTSGYFLFKASPKLLKRLGC